MRTGKSRGRRELAGANGNGEAVEACGKLGREDEFFRSLRARYLDFAISGKGG